MHNGYKGNAPKRTVDADEAKKLPHSPTNIDIEAASKTGRPPNNRRFDSEKKILENILDQTTPNSSGNIKLVSERDLCDSCSNVLDVFRKERPNIIVEVVYRTDYP